MKSNSKEGMAAGNNVPQYRANQLGSYSCCTSTEKTQQHRDSPHGGRKTAGRQASTCANAETVLLLLLLPPLKTLGWGRAILYKQVASKNAHLGLQTSCLHFSRADLRILLNVHHKQSMLTIITSGCTAPWHFKCLLVLLMPENSTGDLNSEPCGRDSAFLLGH